MFETGVPSSTADSTRLRLLEAAGEVFADKGFRDATIREICGRAGANIASINYHFGGKERLYAEVLRYVDQTSEDKHPNMPPETSGMPAEERLRQFVRQFVRRVFDRDRPSWHQRLINREMVEPTFALDELVDSNIRPRSLVIQAIVRELLGARASDEHVQRSAASIVGQCMFFWHCRPVICRLLPHVGYTPDNVESIADHIANFSLQALRGLRAELDRVGGMP